MISAGRKARATPLATPPATSSVMTAKKTNLSRLRLRRPRILWRSLAETLATAVDPLGEFLRFYTARPPLPNFLLNSARLAPAVRLGGVLRRIGWWTWHRGDGTGSRLAETRGKLIARGLHRRESGVVVGRVHKHRLSPVVAADRPPRGRDELSPIERVGADHSLARFLRPHLIEDEIPVRVGDELAVIDLDALVPVRVIADDDV